MATVLNFVAAPAAAPVSPAAPVKLAPFAKGKGAADRIASMNTVAPAAYREGLSRAETINVLRDALGAKPTDDQLATCRNEYVIGRVAFRIARELPVVEALALARDVVLNRAAPSKDGSDKPSRKGGKARRTFEQQKAVRASEEAWSQVKAEACPEVSNAQNQAARNAAKAKRAAAMAGSTKRGSKAGAAPAGAGVTHTELVKPDGAPMTADAAAEYIASMAGTLLMFSNKHAGVVDSTMGAAIRAFHATTMRAKGERDRLKDAIAE